MIEFKEGSITGDQVKVAQSHLHKKENESNFIKFKCGYEGTIEKNSAAKYIDYNGNTLIEGKIKQIKELANDPNTDKKIYEITLYDKGYVLKEQNLNKIYDEGTTPEEIIEDIVELYNLIFVNDLDISSGVTIERRKRYLDRDPIEAVNELCQTIGAVWRVEGSNFILYRIGQNTSSEEIDANAKWTIPEGWIDDTSKQCTRVIVKGGRILQRTTENLSGTGTVFYTTRTPEDVQIEGLTQTTETIDGDYTVKKGDFDVGGTDKKGKIEFESEQTDPVVNYSYYSQIRVEAKVGDGDIVKEIEKNYIESSYEARKFARKYLEIYQDGFQVGEWINPDTTGLNINNFITGDKIQITNKLNPSRDGEYVISKVERRYPRQIKITVGEEVNSLVDWQAEAKDRIKQLTEIDGNFDFVQLDEFLSGDFDVGLTSNFTYLYAIHDTGEVLFASDTTLSSDGDLISDTGDDVDYALAYDDDATFPAGTKTDYLS